MKDGGLHQMRERRSEGERTKAADQAVMLSECKAQITQLQATLQVVHTAVALLSLFA
eukprot:COSAG05_NODE_1190_length_5573_cov_33.432590_1_plen_56_part_10